MRPGKTAVILVTTAILVLSISSVLNITSHPQQTQTANSVPSAGGSGFYPVYLVEHNLPGGMLWYASIGTYYETHYSSPPESTTTPVIEFQEPPGKYSFSVGANGPYLTQEMNIYATVVNKPVTVNIYFVEQYNVSVTETGLPQGYNWELRLTNINNSNDNSGVSGPPVRMTQSIYEGPGTFKVQAGSLLPYGVSILGTVGIVKITDEPVNMTVNFHKVNITENGVNLKNTSWGMPYYHSVVFSNGTQVSKSGFYPGNMSSFSVYLPNSSYSIHPVADGYYSPTLHFNVTGKSLNLTENFQKAYKVTFVVHNLTTDIGGNWQLSGFPTGYGLSQVYLYGSPVQEFLVPNGTFSFNITGISDWYSSGGQLYNVNVTLENANSSFTVNGENLTVNLYFNVNTTPVQIASGPGFLNLIKYLAFSVIIACSAAGVTYLYYMKRKQKP